MTDQFLAEIRIFSGNFAPTGWAFCDGQLLPISQNTALFSLLGTIYGGNGTSNFALPNLQAQAPLHFGQGAGLTERFLGESDGQATVDLLVSQTPAHTHAATATSATGSQLTPAGMVPATPGMSRGASAYTAGAGNGTLAASALSTNGGSTPHNNLPPYLTLTFIIALTGIFPSRG